MVKRKIVDIDKNRCNGCGLCITECAEGALQIVDGKATIVKETYCDGLGACIGYCPQGAIKITKRDAPKFDDTEVREYLKVKTENSGKPEEIRISLRPQWPIKINLVPSKGNFYENADLLIAADCAPVLLKNFREGLLRGRKVLIGCPKSDDVKVYADKLSEILKQNKIASITVAHMEVPCCSSLKWAVYRALESSGKKIPVNEYKITIAGELKDA